MTCGMMMTVLKIICSMFPLFFLFCFLQHVNGLDCMLIKIETAFVGHKLGGYHTCSLQPVWPPRWQTWWCWYDNNEERRKTKNINKQQRQQPTRKTLCFVFWIFFFSCSWRPTYPGTQQWLLLVLSIENWF